MPQSESAEAIWKEERTELFRQGDPGAERWAAGYIKEYPVEKLMRDAKLFQIYEGTTSQIQRS